MKIQIQTKSKSKAKPEGFVIKSKLFSRFVASLELIIRSRRIRNTNIGIYLMAYCILSLLSIILILVNESLQYYTNRLGNEKLYIVFRCFVGKVIPNSLIIFCILLSACIAFERSLIICFDGKINATRWRSCIIIIVLSLIISASSTPMLVYRCEWYRRPGLEFARQFLSWFCVAVGILIYLLATLLVLVSFAHRIHRYGIENNSYIKTFLKLSRTHLFIFLPPTIYALCDIPYTVAYHTNNIVETKKVCVNSVERYILETLMEALEDLPYALTWLLFVYPSRVYMTEFYLNTWSGQRLANILLLCKSFRKKNKDNHLSIASSLNDEQATVKEKDLCDSNVQIYDEVPRRYERVQRKTQQYITIIYDDVYRTG